VFYLIYYLSLKRSNGYKYQYVTSITKFLSEHSKIEIQNAMNSKKKLSQQRLKVLELAKTLNNVSEACRRSGISRTQFYEYRRRFQRYGMDGLKNLPPIHHDHPWTTSLEVTERILGMSLKYPDYGCIKLSNTLKLGGTSVSSPTIQKILIKNNIGKSYARLLKLEKLIIQHAIEPTSYQIREIKRFNPCYRERDNESRRPGELLAQEFFYIGKLTSESPLYLHAVVDTYSSYAIGELHTSRKRKAAVSVLKNSVLPFYKRLGLKIHTVFTSDRSWRFDRRNNDQYEIYITRNKIEHLTAYHSHGFVMRFHRIVSNEFLPAFRTRSYRTIEAAQNAFEDWLQHYNTKRAHEGYRNMGKPPRQAIQDYMKSIAKIS